MHNFESNEIKNLEISFVLFENWSCQYETKATNRFDVRCWVTLFEKFPLHRFCWPFIALNISFVCECYCFLHIFSFKVFFIKNERKREEIQRTHTVMCTVKLNEMRECKIWMKLTCEWVNECNGVSVSVLRCACICWEYDNPSGIFVFLIWMCKNILFLSFSYKLLETFQIENFLTSPKKGDANKRWCWKRRRRRRRDSSGSTSTKNTFEKKRIIIIAIIIILWYGCFHSRCRQPIETHSISVVELFFVCFF